MSLDFPLLTMTKQSLSRSYLRSKSQNIFFKEPKISFKQKTFNEPHPVLQYTRFMPTKKALSGIDPYSKYEEFINKDMIAPLKKPSAYEKFNIKSPQYIHTDSINTKMNPKSKWAIGTVARAPTEETLPKKQPFFEYYFPPQYNNKDIERYRNFTLKTDHIGIKIPPSKNYSDNNDNSKDSFIKMKGGYSSANETKPENQWVPKKCFDTVNNLSSKSYNIINFLPIETYRVKDTLMNKSINLRKKGIGEYYDLCKTFRTNFNKDFAEKFDENHKRFYKYTGIFTNMYDASNRNGKITLPFDMKSKS